MTMSLLFCRGRVRSIPTTDTTDIVVAVVDDSDGDGDGDADDDHDHEHS